MPVHFQTSTILEIELYFSELWGSVSLYRDVGENNSLFRITELYFFTEEEFVFLGCLQKISISIESNCSLQMYSKLRFLCWDVGERIDCFLFVYEIFQNFEKICKTACLRKSASFTTLSYTYIDIGSLRQHQPFLGEVLLRSCFKKNNNIGGLKTVAPQI